MLTLSLFFGTITVSFKRKTRTDEEIIHQHQVNERFERNQEKLVQSVTSF